jgi:hypothetical protein
MGQEDHITSMKDAYKILVLKPSGKADLDVDGRALSKWA